MTGPKDQARDLEADLAICEAATPGPWRSQPCYCGKCGLHILDFTNSDGRLEYDDARFITEARKGWTYAIKRAMEAEEKIDRLQNELQMANDRNAYRRGEYD